MNCSRCHRQAQVKFHGNINYCDRHFLEIIEKRIRKDLRINQNLDTKQTYKILKQNSCEYKLNKHFLSKIFNNRLKLADTKKVTVKTIENQSLDTVISTYLESYLKNTKFKMPKIAPLRTITVEEIRELCRILKIKFTESKTNKLIDNMEKQYAGTKYSLMKSALNLEK